MDDIKLSNLYCDELAAAMQLKRAGVGVNGAKTPVLLHFSDVHNNERALGRVLQLRGECPWLITDIIHTGDSVNNRFCEGVSAFHIPGAETVLNVVGNHDMLRPPEGWDWKQRASNEELYAMLFAPFYAHWGVAMAENTTYWYKDYADYAFRLVGIDATLKDDEAQLRWLARVLDDARQAGYCVMIATHYAPANRVVIPCGFSSAYYDAVAQDNSTALVPALQDVVQGFIEKGGEFICYLSGHTHTDYIWYGKDYPMQLCVTVDSSHIGYANYWSDTLRQEGTKSEDLLNLISFDREQKLVKIVRIGANTNALLQSKRVLAVNYKTMEVINER